MAHGLRVTAYVGRFMPRVFLATLAEDAPGTVRIFDASHDNPELIWNESMRAELDGALVHASNEALASQRSDASAPFALPNDFVVEYPQLKGAT